MLTEALGAARARADTNAICLAAFELGDAHASTRSFAAVRGWVIDRERRGAPPLTLWTHVQALQSFEEALLLASEQNNEVLIQQALCVWRLCV